MKKETPKKIIISRTDSIGDVLLTVPLCKWIKKKFPQTKLIFLCKNYTVPVLEQFSVIDEVLSVSELSEMPFEKQVRFFEKINADWILHVFPNKEIAQLAKKAKIKNRVGTSHRFFHFFTCNISGSASKAIYYWKISGRVSTRRAKPIYQSFAKNNYSFILHC